MATGQHLWNMSREEYDRVYQGKPTFYRADELIDDAPEPDPTGRPPIDYAQITRELSGS